VIDLLRRQYALNGRLFRVDPHCGVFDVNHLARGLNSQLYVAIGSGADLDNYRQPNRSKACTCDFDHVLTGNEGAGIVGAGTRRRYGLRRAGSIAGNLDDGVRYYCAGWISDATLDASRGSRSLSEENGHEQRER